MMAFAHLVGQEPHHVLHQLGWGRAVNGADGKVACRSRLGGMLNYYYREAA